MSIIIKFRKSCNDSYQYETLGMNSWVSQKRYNDITKNYPDVIIRKTK